jgi:hypothetical protein
MPSSGNTTGLAINLAGGPSTGQTLDPGEALPYTLLSPSRYAQIMQIPLPHFWQMQGPKAPLRGGCDDVWDEEARAALVWAMLQAEEMIANELGFYPAPKFTVDEEIAFGLTGVRNDWLNGEVKTKWGYVSDYGTEKLTLVQADAVIQYQDLDDDPNGREETARIGTSLYGDLSACAKACDVAIFFRVADGADDAADDRWEIRPIKVDIDGSTMRITADSALFIKPGLRALTKMDCVASEYPNDWIYNFDLGNLVAKVDVYCRTVNQQTPVTLRWDGVCTCTTSPCAHDTQCACAYPTDMKRGFFAPRPATWNGASNIYVAATYTNPPESVLVDYRSGYLLDSKSCRMNAELERAIVKLTNVLLPEPPCGFCDAAEIRWKGDRKNIDPLTPEAASMPWDLYAQGALEAWRIVKKLAMGRGSKMGRK